MKKRFLGLLFIFCVVGCGGGKKEYTLRIFNGLEGVDSTKILINSVEVISSIPNLTRSEPINVKEGDIFEIYNATTDAKIQSLSISSVNANTGEPSPTSSTLFFLNDPTTNKVSLIQIENDTTPPEAGRSRLRVFSGSKTHPADLEVYFSLPNLSLTPEPTSDQATHFDDLDHGGITSDLSFDSGEYRVRVITLNNLSNVIFDTGAYTFEDGKVYTLVALDDFLGEPASNFLIFEEDVN